MQTPTPEILGIVAGNGVYPRKLADAAGKLFGGANGMKGFDLPLKHPDMNVDADIRNELAEEEPDKPEAKKK